MASPVPGWGDPGSRPEPGAEPGTEVRSDLLARIDACMARLRTKRRAPLVLAGDAALVDELKNSAQLLHRLAGAVVGPAADNPDELFRATALCLEDYLHLRGQQTLDALQEAAADAPEHLVAGLDQCWAVVSRVPGALVVEHGYVHPRPPGEGGGPASHVPQGAR